MKLFSSLLITIFAIILCAPVVAQERLQMEGTEIVGNQELPRVLYIVPWKSVQQFEISTPEVISIMDQKLTPIERASFQRTINYHDAIFAKAKPTP